MPPPSAPVNFPATPLLEAYLLQSPWLLMAALVALGVGLLAVFNARGRAAWGLAAAGIALALAGAAFVVSELVETTSERLQAQTRTLIDAAARGDGEAVAGMLEAGAHVEAGAWSQAQGREAIRELVSTRVKAYDLRSWSVSGLRGTIDGEAGGRTLVRVSVEPEATRLPYASWWMFTWRRDEQGAWKVRSIRLLEGDAGGAWR